MVFSIGNGNHERRHRRWSRFAALVAVAFLATSLLGLAGCSSDSKDPIAVAGVWEIDSLDSAWPNLERWTITNNSIHYESSSDGETFSTAYKATIVDYVNGQLNAGDTALIDGRDVTTNPGFAVIKYTEAANAGWGEAGKFNVFRWADNNEDNTLRDFTQGQKDATPEDEGYVNKVFDTAGEAEEGATNAEGHFGYASMGAGR